MAIANTYKDVALWSATYSVRRLQQPDREIETQDQCFELLLPVYQVANTYLGTMQNLEQTRKKLNSSKS